MIRCLYLFCLLLIVNFGFSQNDVMLFNINDVKIPRVFYVGYENTLQISTTNGLPFDIEGTNIEVTELNKDSVHNIYTFTIKPIQQSDFDSLFLIDRESRNVINVLYFKSNHLPTPELYLSGKADGEKIMKSFNTLYVKYPAEISLVAAFTVESWECVIEGKVNSGTGSVLTENVLSQLAKLKTGKIVYITCKYRGPDGMTRKTSSSFVMN
jgi:hypothetical protein